MSDHHQGLRADLQRLGAQAAGRRRLLHWLGGGAASVALAACGGGGDADAATAESATSGGSSSGGSCSLIPEETAGPYPGDGSNSNGSGIANALALSGIVRNDIRSSIAGASAVATGVPLTVRLRLLNTNGSCAALSGHAVYLWHCDAQGRYSMYSAGVTEQNYLRGVAATGDDGRVSFTTIFPGCYDGRMPHMHFEVYRSLALATHASYRSRTSQLAFPLATCQSVYASSGYANSAANLARTSFASDNVFSDGVSLQMASLSGDVNQGFVAELDVAISA